MKTLTSTKHPTRAFVIAENEDDVKALEFFFPITWGFYMLWRRKTGIIPKDPLVIKILSKLKSINVLAIGCLQSPKGFVPQDVLKREQLMLEKAQATKEEKELLDRFIQDLTT